MPIFTIGWRNTACLPESLKFARAFGRTSHDPLVLSLLLTSLMPLSQDAIPRFAERMPFERELEAAAPVARAVIASVLHESSRHPDVDDCLQESMRRAFEGKSRLREGEALRPWLVGIARHVALDTLRSRKRTRAREAPRGHEEENDEAPIERVADAKPDALETLWTRERTLVVERALADLPKGTREALVLFHTESLGYQQIAERLGVPLGTVATWVNRGRKALAAAIEEMEGSNAGGTAVVGRAP